MPSTPSVSAAEVPPSIRSLAELSAATELRRQRLVSEIAVLQNLNAAAESDPRADTPRKQVAISVSQGSPLPQRRTPPAHRPVCPTAGPRARARSRRSTSHRPPTPTRQKSYWSTGPEQYEQLRSMFGRSRMVSGFGATHSVVSDQCSETQSAEGDWVRRGTSRPRGGTLWQAPKSSECSDSEVWVDTGRNRAVSVFSVAEAAEAQTQLDPASCGEWHGAPVTAADVESLRAVRADAADALRSACAAAADVDAVREIADNLALRESDLAKMASRVPAMEPLSALLVMSLWLRGESVPVRPGEEPDTLSAGVRRFMRQASVKRSAAEQQPPGVWAKTAAALSVLAHTPVVKDGPPEQRTAAWAVCCGLSVFEVSALATLKPGAAACWPCVVSASRQRSVAEAQIAAFARAPPRPGLGSILVRFEGPADCAALGRCVADLQLKASVCDLILPPFTLWRVVETTLDGSSLFLSLRIDPAEQHSTHCPLIGLALSSRTHEEVRASSARLLQLLAPVQFDCSEAEMDCRQRTALKGSFAPGQRTVILTTPQPTAVLYPDSDTEADGAQISNVSMADQLTADMRRRAVERLCTAGHVATAAVRMRALRVFAKRAIPASDGTAASSVLQDADALQVSVTSGDGGQQPAEAPAQAGRQDAGSEGAESAQTAAEAERASGRPAPAPQLTPEQARAELMAAEAEAGRARREARRLRAAAFSESHAAALLPPEDAWRAVCDLPSGSDDADIRPASGAGALRAALALAARETDDLVGDAERDLSRVAARRSQAAAKLVSAERTAALATDVIAAQREEEERWAGWWGAAGRLLPPELQPLLGESASAVAADGAAAAVRRAADAASRLRSCVAAADAEADAVRARLHFLRDRRAVISGRMAALRDVEDTAAAAAAAAQTPEPPPADTPPPV